MFIFFSSIEVNMWRYFAKPAFVFGCVFLGLTLMFGIVSRGAVRWIEIFGFRFQVSEFMKPIFVLSLSAFLSDESKDLKYKMLLAILFLIPIILVFEQPDFGSALVYMAFIFIMLIFSGISLRVLIFGALICVMILPFGWNLLRDYQKERLVSFMSPKSDHLGNSYNAIQSVITVGAGGLFGQGIGKGTQSHFQFLPENHTDFIFSSFSEEFGFFGSIILMLIYLMLFLRLWRIYVLSTESYSKLLVLGVLTIFWVQWFINVGMNIGLLPITGITLPLVSYGGSSIISSCILLGLVSGVLRQNHSKIA